MRLLVVHNDQVHLAWAWWLQVLGWDMRSVIGRRFSMTMTPSAPLLGGFAAALLGVGLSEWLRSAPTVWLGLLGVALFCLVIALRARHGTFLASLCTCTCVYALHASTLKTPPFPDHLCQSGTPEAGLFRVIVDAPIGRVPERDDPQRMRQRTIVRLSSQACDGVWEALDGRVSVTLPPGPVFGTGDTLAVAMRLVPLPARRSFEQLDAQTRGRRQQISALGRDVTHYAQVAQAKGPRASLERWRQRTAQRFEAVLPAQTAPLGKALALGDQAGIATTQRQAWADAGIAHLLSVSGLHVALVAWLLSAFVQRLVAHLPGAGERYGVRRVAVFVTLPGVVVYGVVTGGSAAALRSMIMACTLLVGTCVRRPGTARNALGLAGLLLLAASPMAVYDPGFWLSFVAIGALLVLPGGEAPDGLISRAWFALRAAFVASVAATVATAPLTAWYFGRISCMAPFTNLLAVPVGSFLATPLALGLALFAPLSGAVASALGAMLHTVLWGLDELATKAAQPWAAFDVARPSAWALACCVLVAACTQFASGTRRRRCLAVALSLLLITLAAPYGAASPGTLRVSNLYVGQGDATVVQFPGGDVMLVDGGGAVQKGALDPGRHMVLPALQALGVRRVDIMVATHPHPDHINGLLAVAERYAVGELWYNGTGAAVPAMGALIERVRLRGGVVRTAQMLPAALMRQGVKIERLHPTAPLDASQSANDNSLVLRLQYKARSILLSGDVEAWGEAQTAAKLIPTDILKVPHHGSRTSSGRALLDAAKPRLAVVSCGDENRFGFPHPQVTARYASSGVPLWRTDADGQVVAQTDGAVWDVRSSAGMRLTIED